MSRKGLSALVLSAFAALVITFGMYWYTLELMKEEIGQRLMSIAATAAPEINAKDLRELLTVKDMQRPEYQKIYKKLNEIRDANEDIIYAYIMRPTINEGSIWEFVVDADTTIGMGKNPDTSPTGMKYDLLPFSPVLNSDGLNRPTYEEDFIYDQWGVSLSGSAPIFNVDGKGVAVLGIDMDVSSVHRKVQDKFRSYIWFFTIFTFLVMARVIMLSRAIYK